MSKHVFVLGAGASRDGGIPLTSEILKVGWVLLKDLSERLTEKHKEALKRKAKGEPPIKFVPASELDFLDFLGYQHQSTFQSIYTFLEQEFGWDNDLNNIPNIEELWGILDIATQTHANFGLTKSSDVKRALDLLTQYVLMGCRVEDEPKWHVVYIHRETNPYSAFVKKLPTNSTVISLNYDTWLDSAIRSAGKPIDYGSNFIPYQPEDLEIREKKKHETVELLKLHGSFNWLYCPTCNSIEDFGPFHVSNISAEQVDLWNVDADLPCRYDRTLREPVIVPPSLIKVYSNIHLTNIWRRAEEALHEADQITFIGYSFRGADIHVKYLFKQNISINPNVFMKGKSIVAVVNHSDDAIKTYQQWFGSGMAKTFKMDFSDYVDKEM